SSRDGVDACEPPPFAAHGGPKAGPAKPVARFVSSLLLLRFSRWESGARAGPRTRDRISLCRGRPDFDEDFAEARLVAGRPDEGVAVAGAMVGVDIDVELA